MFELLESHKISGGRKMSSTNTADKSTAMYIAEKVSPFLASDVLCEIAQLIDSGAPLNIDSFRVAAESVTGDLNTL